MTRALDRVRRGIAGRTLVAFALPIVVLALLAADCGGDDNSLPRESGSAALLGFDTKNISAIAIDLDPSPSVSPLHVYLGVPGQDPLFLPPGRHVIALVTPFGDMQERLVSTAAPEGEEIDLTATFTEDSPTQRDAQRADATTLIDFALVFKLSRLQIEQALTEDFTRPIGDPSTEVTDDEAETVVDTLSGLSDYESLVVDALERLFQNSPYKDLVVAGTSGGRLLSPAPAEGVPGQDTLKNIKDFGTKNGKGGNDARARDTLLRNTQDLNPEQQQQVFDDLKSGTSDNRNVKEAGGISETNAADFFKALQNGKYDRIAQDLEKGARANPDYIVELKSNKDTPGERGAREGGEALKQGAKVIDDLIKEAIPGPAQKVVGIGEKIDDLLDKKKPTDTPTRVPLKSRQESPTSTPTTTLPPTETPTTIPQPPGATPTHTPTTVPATPTNTPVPPTATFTPVPPTATNTPVPPTSTNTPVPPTSTNTPVPGTPTNTSVPPGPGTPTNTPPPNTPTNTPLPVPATDTPIAEPATQSPKEFINEITGLRVILVKLGKGDDPDTTSYEIDVRVATKVRTRPAAMVNCVTPFGTGHNIGSSSLFPGETFGIPLHRQDLGPGEVVEVTCTIRQGNSMSGAVTVPGKCPAKAGAALGAALAAACDRATQTPTQGVTTTPSASAATETATPGVTATPGGATHIPTSAAPTVTPLPLVPTDTPLPVAATDTPAPAIPTPTAVPPTLPPPTATTVPVATPTFEPEVIDGLFWPGNVFGVETSVVLQTGRLYQICFSGIMHMEEGDMTPAEMAHVNGASIGGNCVSLEGNGAKASITCGSGTPLDDPGGFNISVTDLGPF